MARKTQLEQLRESERLLASELTRLRQRIKAAETGENKRIKDTQRYIARVNKTIAKTQAKQAAAQEKELEKLERILGETFESVTEARSAFRKQTSKPTKREVLAYQQTERKRELEAAKKATTEKSKKRHLRRAENLERQIESRKLDHKKHSYSVRDLSAKENAAVLDFLTDKKMFIDVGKNYLQDNERIIISVPYHYKGTDGRTHTDRALGHKVLNNWSDLQRYLLSYFDEDSTEEWLGSIQVMKMPSTYTDRDHKIIKARDKDRREARIKEVKKMYADRDKTRRKKEREAAKERKQKAVIREREKAKKEKAKLKDQIKQLKRRQ